MKIEFSATKRSLQGTGASRRLRRSGKVPAIVYGGDQTAQPIELDHNALFHSLKSEAFHASVLDMNLEGQKLQVLLRDVQMHAYKAQVLHVDFQRIAADEKIHMKVPLHFINADIAPGVKMRGGIVSHVMNELEVTCLPKDLPEFIEVDLKEADVGHSIHVNDLKMPQGVVPKLHKGKGENPVVATIIVPRGTTADEVAGAEEAAAAAAASAAAATPPAGVAKQPEKK